MVVHESYAECAWPHETLILRRIKTFKAIYSKFTLIGTLKHFSGLLPTHSIAAGLLLVPSGESRTAHMRRQVRVHSQ